MAHITHREALPAQAGTNRIMDQQRTAPRPA